MALPTRTIAVVFWAVGAIVAAAEWWPLVRVLAYPFPGSEGLIVPTIWSALRATLFAATAFGALGTFVWVLGEIRDRLEPVTPTRATR